MREAAEATRKSQEQYHQIMTDINVFRSKLRSLLESQLTLVDHMQPDIEHIEPAAAPAAAVTESPAETVGDGIDE